MLLEIVKESIKSDDVDADVLILIERGKNYIMRLTGTVLDFEAYDLPQQLLIAYCRYDLNNSIEFFKQNFAEDILFLSLTEAIKTMEAEVVL